MKRKIAFLLSAIICLTFSIYAIATDFDNKLIAMEDPASSFGTSKMTKEESTICRKALNQYDAVVYYDKLISAFIDKYGEKDGQPSSYPDNYAGAYINDNGKLVIQITVGDGENISYKDNIKDYSAYVDFLAIKESDVEFKAMNIEEIIEFDKSPYSLNDLKEMLENTVENVRMEFPVTG